MFSIVEFLPLRFLLAECSDWRTGPPSGLPVHLSSCLSMSEEAQSSIDALSFRQGACPHDLGQRPRHCSANCGSDTMTILGSQRNKR